MTRFKATGIIAKAFEEEGIYYRIEQREEREMVCAGFSIEMGPLVKVYFISCDNDNDVFVRIFSLINSIPEKKWPGILKAINRVNCEARYVKFSLDEDGDINVGIDVPIECSDSCLGKVACELFYYIVQCVRDHYLTITRVLYTEDREDDGIDRDAFEKYINSFITDSGNDDDLIVIDLETETSGISDGEGDDA